MNNTFQQDCFKALADQTRLRIVVLLTKGELCVCDLTKVLNIPQSTISRHLSILKYTGLVTDRRGGKWVYYQLSDNPLLSHLMNYFNEISNVDPFNDDRMKLEKFIPGRICN